jgi:hypothetical protein
MDEEWTAATLGIVACVVTAGAVAAPYLLLPADQLDGLGAYYALGVVSPLAPGLLGVLLAVVFAAGREDRSDPDLVAGITLTIALFSLAVALQWALAFRPDIVASRATLEFLSDHRWSVPAAALLEAVAALWYAGARGLVPLPSPLVA